MILTHPKMAIDSAYAPLSEVRGVDERHIFSHSLEYRNILCKTEKPACGPNEGDLS